MIKEVFTKDSKQIAINVTQSKIDSIRKKNIKKTAVRVYDKQKIGISSSIGYSKLEALTDEAKEALSYNIPYIAKPSKNKTEHIPCKDSLMSDENFTEEMKILLEILEKNNPDFSFSNKLIIDRNSYSLKNDVGLDLYHEKSRYNFSLLINHKDSSNLFDSVVGYQSSRYNRNQFVTMTSNICNAYNNPIEKITPGKYPVIFMAEDNTYLKKMLTDLNGKSYATNSSLFSGKQNQKLFNDNFSLFDSKIPSNDSLAPFFDTEGTVNHNYKSTLIENGFFVIPYTDKQTARKYDLKNTGSAGGKYDSVPSIGSPNFYLESTGKTTKEMLSGQNGILVVIASGGDFTPDGHFGTPVQASFLFDGEKLIGRLPEISISSDVYSMFGKDFVGVSTDNLFDICDSRLTVMNMLVK